MRALRLAFVALLASPVFASGAGIAAAPLVQHRAVYDLKLDDASDSSGITGISGRMVYEIRGSACEGYTVRFRYVTQSDTREASQITDQQTTTFEDADGKSFSFVTKSYTDQNLDKELRGNATREPHGVKVQIDKPETKSIELQPTQFPTQHLVDLIGKAKTGETFYETSIFDGSEDADKAMTTTVIVGKQASTSSTDPEMKALHALSTRKILAGRHRLFRRGDGRRRGHAGIPHQLQALRERADPRSRDGLWRFRHPRASSSISPCSSQTPSRLQPLRRGPLGRLCR